MALLCEQVKDIANFCV